MPVKRATRSELVDRALLLDEMAVQSLIRNFPSVIRTLDDLVLLVTPLGDPNPDLFNLLADQWRESHPNKEMH